MPNIHKYPLIELRLTRRVLALQALIHCDVWHWKCLSSLVHIRHAKFSFNVGYYKHAKTVPRHLPNQWWLTVNQMLGSKLPWNFKLWLKCNHVLLKRLIWLWTLQDGDNFIHLSMCWRRQQNDWGNTYKILIFITNNQHMPIICLNMNCVW